MKLNLSAAAAGAILAFAGAPVMAQGVECGGIGPGGTWIGGSPEQSDIAAATGALVLTGQEVPSGGNAVALFSLSQPMEIRVEAQPAPGGDSVIELYDASGALVVTDDDSGGGLASRAETPLQPGEYCLATRGFGGTGLVADIAVGQLTHAAITEGLSGGFVGGGDVFPPDGPIFVGIDPCLPDTPATMLGAGPLAPVLDEGGAEATNTISGVPYYRFTLGAPEPLTIRAENPSADPYIYIFDGQGTLLAENDDYQSLNSRIDFTEPLPAGDYCIGIRALSNPDLPVTVRVMRYDQQAALNELYASGEAAPPMDGSWPFVDMGPLPPRAVRDAQVSGRNAEWFAFEMPSRGMLLIDAVEVTDSDPMIALFDDLGREIAFNDDANGTLNSQLAVRLDPGRYLLSVVQYSEGYQGIIRIATERFVPATE
ncbi:PPC domain-containing protein [Maritalea mobilis]|uniref:pre-peptidase C-terminal domain-containing protein n=1 Tax=Maritalea mobilis TaxID=483324 RepID=UPI001C9639D6|nr:pre-peptidase C-terminal domain-containing protein [Maritalea mobilis]MBY6200028.1 PPC domain-containing protein [Maritalea mobilis]